MEIFLEITKQHTIGNYEYKDIVFQVLDFSTLQYATFFDNFMVKNRPCIINNVSLNWECTNKWITNNNIDYEYLSKTYGDLEAPVADCHRIDYNAHHKINMKVSDYMAYLKNDKRDRLLYLKDWHLRKIKASDRFYEVPFLFGADWLNEFAMDHQEDDFMFVYIGPKNSWTPLHVDVYNSYSWSVNVVGRKKWIIFPPGEEEKLKDSLGNLPLQFNTEKKTDVIFYEVIQEQGDAIFVPSGWYHQVENLLDTISINHNWLNSCNIRLVWEALQKNLISVEHEIEQFKDTPEFSSQCQLILKSLFGLDVSTFVSFLCYIGKKRLSQLEGYNKKVFNQFYLGKKHIEFDLHIILQLIHVIQNEHLLLRNCLSVESFQDVQSLKITISSLKTNG